MTFYNYKLILSTFYFGRLPNYFDLWLHSCAYNSTVDFIIFTDDDHPYNYPKNVNRVLLPFKDFQQRFHNKYEFKISMNDAYHACDYVPAFGDVFSFEFEKYDFWGHCDIDLIFGDIRKFVTDNILDGYDKISWRGHFSLYKNTTAINTAYKSKIYGEEFYKTIFTNPTNALFAFEENEINHILEANGYKIYKGLPFADLTTCTNNFQMMHFSEGFQKKNKFQIFEFNKGTLTRHYVDGKKHITEEIMYVHFLKRPMVKDKSFSDPNQYLIIPNRFITCKEVNAKKIIKWNKKRFYYSYYADRLNWKYYKKRKKGIQTLKRFDELYGKYPRVEYKLMMDDHFDN